MYLTVKEVADRLKLSIGAIYRAIQAGTLECHRFGAAIRVSEDQLVRFLDESRSIRTTERDRRRTFKHLDL